MVEKIHIAFAAVFLLIAVLIFRPVPIVKEDRAVVVQGVVSGVYEAGVKDLVIRLENVDQRYYINRGLENGPEMTYWKDRIVGKEVIIKYPKYWTPLDWNNTVRHLSKLECEGEVLFNKLRP